MKQIPAFAWMALLMASCLPCELAFAQAPPSQGSGDPTDKPGSEDVRQTVARAELAAIRQTANEFIQAFNAGDAKAVAALWTADGDYTDESGQTFAGRDAIETEYAAFFKAHPGIQLRMVIDALRLLSPDTAIEDGRVMLDPAPEGPPAISKYTTVHVKVDGKWRMSTVRDARIELPSTHRAIADLAWLIGDWKAEEHGAATVANCSWVANKSFVQRTYQVTHPDHSTSSGVQIIGFNPQGGHLQSWSFTSDGGHAVGIWSPRENGWQVEVHGLLPNGAQSRAINLLIRIDENAYSWQSVQRTIGNESLPDTEEVILKRESAK